MCRLREAKSYDAVPAPRHGQQGDAGEYRAWQACGGEDLIAALDSGQLSYTALDALWPEPLPPTSPLMPHVARRLTVAQLVTEIAANISSVETGGGFCSRSKSRPGANTDKISVARGQRRARQWAAIG
jgi:hypothetical protein